MSVHSLSDYLTLTDRKQQEPAAMYMNRNLSTLVRASIGSFGPDVQALFTPMPHATIALAATCVGHVHLVCIE
jgi:hypothetical protein